MMLHSISQKQSIDLEEPSPPGGVHRSAPISPVHASGASSLLSRTTSQGALELEKGAANLVAHAGVALVVVDRDGGRVGVVSVVSVMGFGPAAEDAPAGGASCDNGGSPGLAGGEEAAAAGGCGGGHVLAAHHFDGCLWLWLCLWFDV